MASLVDLASINKEIKKILVFAEQELVKVLGKTAEEPTSVSSGKEREDPMKPNDTTTGSYDLSTSNDEDFTGVGCESERT